MNSKPFFFFSFSSRNSISNFRILFSFSSLDFLVVRSCKAFAVPVDEREVSHNFYSVNNEIHLQIQDGQDLPINQQLTFTVGLFFLGKNNSLWLFFSMNSCWKTKCCCTSHATKTNWSTTTKTTGAGGKRCKRSSRFGHWCRC